MLFKITNIRYPTSPECAVFDCLCLICSLSTNPNQETQVKNQKPICRCPYYSLEDFKVTLHKFRGISKEVVSMSVSQI